MSEKPSTFAYVGQFDFSEHGVEKRIVSHGHSFQYSKRGGKGTDWKSHLVRCDNLQGDSQLQYTTYTVSDKTSEGRILAVLLLFTSIINDLSDLGSSPLMVLVASLLSVTRIFLLREF